MNTKLKIDRAKLAETFAEIRARPDLHAHRTGLLSRRWHQGRTQRP